MKCWQTARAMIPRRLRRKILLTQQKMSPMTCTNRITSFLSDDECCTPVQHLMREGIFVLAWGISVSYIIIFIKVSLTPGLDVLNRFPNPEEPIHTIHVMKYIFPRQFGLHNVFTSQVDQRQTVQPFKDYTLREEEITHSEELERAKRQQQLPKVPKRLRGCPFQLVKKLQKRNRNCSYTELLRHYCPIEVCFTDTLTKYLLTAVGNGPWQAQISTHSNWSKNISAIRYPDITASFGKNGTLAATSCWWRIIQHGVLCQKYTKTLFDGLRDSYIFSFCILSCSPSEADPKRVFWSWKGRYIKPTVSYEANRSIHSFDPVWKSYTPWGFSRHKGTFYSQKPSIFHVPY